MKRVLILGFLAVFAVAAFAAPAISQPVSSSTEVVEETGKLFLTYIDSASTYVGQGVVYILNLIVGKDTDTGEDRLSRSLERPVGYLAMMTLILILFGLIDFARKIIWIGIIVGWILLIARIVLDAVGV